MVDLNQDGWETGGEEAGGWWGLESLEHLKTGQEGGRLVGGDGRVARGGRDLKPEGPDRSYGCSDGNRIRRALT